MGIAAPEAIYEVSVADGATRRIYANGSADGVTVTRDGATLYFERSTLDRPADIYGIGRNDTAARQITQFKDGRVLWPSISYDGNTIVFERDFGIWKLDVASGKAGPIEIARRGAPSGPETSHLTLEEPFRVRRGL